MEATKKRELENQLMVMGLGGLEDANLIPQIAMIINIYGKRQNDPHGFYEGLLGACDAPKRRQMYDAIKPHLDFDPRPLDSYLARIKERAAAAESQKIPVEIGEKKYQEVRESEANGAVAEFNCYRCTAFNRYLGDTFVSAVLMGRNDGWTRDLVRQKEVCPKCSKVVN